MYGVNLAVVREISWLTPGGGHRREPSPSPGKVRLGLTDQVGPAVPPPVVGPAPVDRLDGPSTPVCLTRREADVLGLLARRWTDKEIAAALGISPRTAMGHV
jgi:hypothetical protein